MRLLKWQAMPVCLSVNWQLKFSLCDLADRVSVAAKIQLISDWLFSSSASQGTWWILLHRIRLVWTTYNNSPEPSQCPSTDFVCCCSWKSDCNLAYIIIVAKNSPSAASIQNPSPCCQKTNVCLIIIVICHCQFPCNVSSLLVGVCSSSYPATDKNH